jgi:V/A-type H+-transporting ATPase subunit D
MMDVSPTRGTLLKLQQQLADLRDRHDLLDRKREVLVRELMQRLEQAGEVEEQMRQRFQAAHQAIELARMRLGSDRIEWINLAPTAELDVQVQISTIMGLRVPHVEMNLHPIAPPYGLEDTSAALDEARRRWLDVVEHLAGATDVLTAAWRLAAEVRKTQRQVNALESALIPRYERTISHIEERLEENEREDIVHAKKVKEMQAAD